MPMNPLEFTYEEMELLNEILPASLAALEQEILHTDHLGYKTQLKYRREVLQHLIAKLQQPLRVSAAV